MLVDLGGSPPLPPRPLPSDSAVLAAVTQRLAQGSRLGTEAEAEAVAVAVAGVVAEGGVNVGMAAWI